MAKIPRVRERTVSAQELRDDEERCRRAREARRVLAPPPIEGNLAAVLVLFARWRKCCCCQQLTLYVNSQARTTGDFECGLCKGIRADLARRMRPSLPMRAALHLWGLFSPIGNDNGEARA